MTKFLLLSYLIVFLRVKNAELFGQTDSNSLKVSVVGATDTYKCYGNPPNQQCYNVSSYSLWQKKMELGCRGEGLIINFGLQLQPGDLNLTYSSGFLANKGAENNIYEQQIYSKNCKIIRRYYVNKDYSLVTVGTTTEYLDNSDTGSFILTQLRQQGFYWQYLVNRIYSGLYDEDEDTIEYLMIILWSFLLFCTSYTGYTGYINCFSHVREIKRQYNQNKPTKHTVEIPSVTSICSNNEALLEAFKNTIGYKSAIETVNSNMGHRLANSTDKEALLEAFKQKIGYERDKAKFNPNLGYRIANSTNKEALLEAFRQNIGYESDKEASIMEVLKQNGTRVTRAKNLKNA